MLTIYADSQKKISILTIDYCPKGFLKENDVSELTGLNMQQLCAYILKLNLIPNYQTIISHTHTKPYMQKCCTFSANYTFMLVL